ncbi:MAG: family 16 glycoside hydrolase [Planctomycetota bacterium]|nr:family 16 glycoside hydrolase [Planctomycetota bacterium]
MHSTLYAVCTLALLSAFSPASGASLDGEKIAVLVVGGANNHDCEWTTPSLERMLTSSGLFEVTVTEDPAAFLADADRIARFRVFVLDYNGPRWGAAAEEHFLAAVRGGAGVAVIHAANNAFRGWVEYEKLVGLMWREGTGHGRFHPFDVQITDRDHPITRSLPDLLAHPDELYHKLVPMHGVGNRVIGVAKSAKETGGTGADEPMIVVKSYGKGRVFHTPLGHVGRNNVPSRASHEDDQFQNLVVRGTEWAATGAVTDGLPRPNSLTEAESAAGWRLLFDGSHTTGWHRHGTDAFPDKGWEVIDGCLVHRAGGGGGDIVTDEQFGLFELEFEWKVAAGANSGIKYLVQPIERPSAMLGCEYQLLDDTRHRDGKNREHAAGSLYDVFPAAKAPLRPTGAFNHAKIVVRSNRIQHWLNGALTVDEERGGDTWGAAVTNSKFRKAAQFGLHEQGHIGIQDHHDEVWIRSIRIRELDR